MLRPCRFPYAFPDTRVRLAKQTHSLVRFSKRTTGHRLPPSPTTGLRLPRSSEGLLCPVAPSPPDFRLYFSSLLGILFSVRSRYLFTIGLEEYLVLAVDACHLHEEFPVPATLELTHELLDQSTGLSPCIALRFRRLRMIVRSMRVSPNTTLPKRLRFGLGRVHSRLLTASRSISLPDRTKMFQFRSFPIAQGNCEGIPIRRS